MSHYEATAREYASKAQKKLNGFGFFGNKYEDAADLLERAGNHYKLAKVWGDAGETYVKLAEVQMKLESRHDAATAWVEAAKCFLKSDQRRGVKCLQQAVSLYTDMGRLGMAARQLKEIAEVLEKEGNKEESLMFYEQAADLFATDNATSESNKCRLKIAQFSAELEQYPQAVAIYEDVARSSVENNLLKYSAKGYLLNAGICCLCYADPYTMQNALERYKDIDITFDGSRECKLLTELAESLESGDIEAFTTAVADFDSMTRLDPWKTALLVRIKRKLTSREEVEEEDLT